MTSAKKRRAVSGALAREPVSRLTLAATSQPSCYKSHWDGKIEACVISISAQGGLSLQFFAAKEQKETARSWDWSRVYHAVDSDSSSFKLLSIFPLSPRALLLEERNAIVMMYMMSLSTKHM